MPWVATLLRRGAIVAKWDVAGAEQAARWLGLLKNAGGYCGQEGPMRQREIYFLLEVFEHL
jgi:hypothetical protein